LDDGLLPKNLAQGRISAQFAQLAKEARINEKTFTDLRTLMLSKTAEVEKLVAASFLHETTKRAYLQHYYGRIKQFTKP
jgi:serine/threonine-protein kinase HipA